MNASKAANIDPNSKLSNITQELEKLFSVNLDLFCITDLGGTLLRVNKAWESTLGYRDETLIGKNISQFVHPDDAAQIHNILEKLAQQELAVSFVGRCRRADNTYLYFEWRSRSYGGMIYSAARDITERVYEENERKRIKELLDEAQHIAHIGSWERDYQTNRIIWSDECFQIFGVKKASYVPTSASILEICLPDDRTVIENAREESQKGKVYTEYEYRILRPDGETRYIYGTRRTYCNESGKAVRSMGTMQDITERKLIELELQRIKENLEEAQSIAHIGSWERDYRTDTYFWSDECYRIFGVDKDSFKLTHDSHMSLRHPDDRHIVQNAIEVAFNGKSFLEYEYRIIRPDGEIRYLRSTRKTIYDEAGKPIRAIGVNQDITEQKLNEMETKRIREFFEQAQSNAHIGIWERDLRTDAFFWSDEMYRIFGVDKSAAISSEGVMKLRHPEDRKKAQAAIDASLNGKDYLEHEYRIIHPNGEIRHVRATRKTFYDESGIAIRGLGTSQDVTERKQLERDVFNERELFKATLLSICDGVISTDVLGNITIMNSVAEALCGIKREDAIGMPLEKVFHTLHEFTRKPIRNPVKRVLETGEVFMDESSSVLILSTGDEIAIERSAAPIRDNEGNTTGVVIVFRDISGAKEKQKQVEYLSLHDHLTGLYNRAYMEDAIKRLDTARNLPFSIMLLDVNGLKLTNDAFGHQMGDRLLKVVADILIKNCRVDDIICRIGGDEFAVLLPKTNAVQTERIRQRIIDTAATTKLDSVIVSLAIGFSVKQRRNQSVMDIYKEADNLMYKNKMQFGKIMRSQTIETVLRNINSKYDQEQIHTERVSQYCESIARAMNQSSKEIEKIKIAGILHDIGKIIVPAEVLNKPDKLTPEEIELIRRHPSIGYQILKGVDEYAAFAEAVLYHHERWDGTGYPIGLKQEEIPLQARIIAIADAYEAMTAKRSYQKTKTMQEARSELIKEAGFQFDPKIVQVFVNKVL